MPDVTQILSQIDNGDPSAADQLLPLVYDELRRLAAANMANEKSGQTLQPTALVHEAYMRLVDVPDPQRWDGRRHFFAAAARSMRRILVEESRRKHSLKRGGNLKRVPLADVQGGDAAAKLDLIALDEALNELAAESPELAQIVELRYFAGLSHEETAAALGLAVITVKRHWRYSRVWLQRKMEGKEQHPAG